MIKALIFDLDDTLYPEQDYVFSGFSSVARMIKEKTGYDIYSLLCREFKKDKNCVFQRVLNRNGMIASDDTIKAMIHSFRTQIIKKLDFYKDVKPLLKYLQKKNILTGIITDGRVESQQAKLDSLFCKNYFDEIIISDSLGGEEFRKPNPIAFEIMRQKMNITFNEMAYVGDNRKKDFAIGEKGVFTIEILRKNKIHNASNYFKDLQPNIIIKSLKQIKKIIC